VGVNTGSLEKDILARFGRPSPEALVESAFRSVRALEREGFLNFKVSLKSSSVEENVVAAALFAGRSEAPLHLGLTEAGPLIPGVVKSALGIGLILVQGIGETIRVSLTRDPVEEVKVGYEILRALGLRRRGVEIISCPTCGRTEIDLMGLVEEVERRLAHVEEDLTVAVMGCVVNGPGEAKEADLGVAGGRGSGLLFSRGEKLRKVEEAEIVSALVEEVEARVASKPEN
jgi:(E)-4-hydroxy-3-methylbut-2-enyl-diphosphate synthase